MTEEILDNERESKLKRKFNWTIWIAPLFVLIGLIKCQQNGILMESPVLVTLLLFILVVFGNIVRPDLGMILSTLIFVLGLFGICQLFPRQEFFGLGLGRVSFSVELYAMLLLIVHIVLTAKSHQRFLNFRKINKG